MLKGKYCMKKWSGLDPDHFLSSASPCPRSLILQQLNIFKIFFHEASGTGWLTGQHAGWKV